jgi:transposase-like protein
VVRPDRDRLTGRVEVDEAYLGGLEEGVRGRQTERKALIVVAAQEDGPGIGRIRMRRIVDASAGSLVPFVQVSVEGGSVVHTDAWVGYDPLKSKGYDHEVTFLKGNKKTPSELMPRVHRVISLLKRWLMGTHQGAVSLEHLDYYLDEFTFRFNRRKSRSRASSSFVSSSRPSPSTRSRTNRWSNATQPPSCPTTRCRGYLSQVNTHLTEFGSDRFGILVV